MCASNEKQASAYPNDERLRAAEKTQSANIEVLGICQQLLQRLDTHIQVQKFAGQIAPEQGVYTEQAYVNDQHLVVERRHADVTRLTQAKRQHAEEKASNPRSGCGSEVEAMASHAVSAALNWGSAVDECVNVLPREQLESDPRVRDNSHVLSANYHDILEDDNAKSGASVSGGATEWQLPTREIPFMRPRVPVLASERILVNPEPVIVEATNTKMSAALIP